MKCAQFAVCLRDLAHAEIKKQKDFPFCNYPCKDEKQCLKCIEHYDRRPIIACSEHDRRYALYKQSDDFEVICIHVDGGLFEKNDPDARCDYAFYLKDSEKRLMLIELKGSDSSHALDQLSAMLEWEGVKEANTEKIVGRIYGRIVCTRGVPNIYKNKSRSLQLRFLQCNGNLKILNRNGEERYQEIDCGFRSN